MLTGDELYREVVKRGIEHASHESDLYIPVNLETAELIGRYEYKANVTKFRHQVTKETWYDIPFAYMPFWAR